MGETDEAAPSKAGSAAPTAAASKRRKYTTRGKRGGKKHRSAKSKREDVSNAPDHARKIALYHVLEKKIARATDEKELVELRAQQEQLGGIKTYQQASLHGARHGESSKWLVAALEARHGRRPTRLLDVGAIAGTSYRKYRSIKPTYIDIDPQADHVIKADFLKYPVQEEPFDVVCLSLVLNFVGSIEGRVEILRRAHLFVREEGYLYVVLPLACVAK